MGSNDLINSVSKGYILLANILSTAKIENLLVPDVAQSGMDVTLDCQYYAPDDNFVLLWFFNGSESPVYKWSPRTTNEVAAAGVLEGHLDHAYMASRIPKEGHALRITQIEPRMSGNYTCVLVSKGFESRQTRSMIVYRPEQEIDLIIDDQRKSFINITCLVRGVFPQPDLVIEYNKTETISQQYQRVWHDRELYNAESKAQIAVSKCKLIDLEIKCRLCLPQVDYTAIKKRYLHLDNNCNLAWMPKSARLYILIGITVISNYVF